VLIRLKEADGTAAAYDLLEFHGIPSLTVSRPNYRCGGRGAVKLRSGTTNINRISIAYVNKFIEAPFSLL